MRLLFCSKSDDAIAWRERLRGLAPDIEMRVWPGTAGNLDEIDAALVWKPPRGLLAKLPKLKLILSLGMGVDHIFADPTLPKHVPLARLVDPDLVDRMSEYCALAVLRYHRDADTYDADQARKAWRPRPGSHASERSVGIMGLGEIGGDLAMKLALFGFKLRGWTRSPKSLSRVECFSGREGLVAFLASAEILVCLLPLTPETENILDARAFAALPRGAVVINAARGAHVVDDDLLAALDSGHIAAAQLDVFRTEPLPPAHPFWTHPKIRVTPHNAAITNPDTAARQFADNLRRLARGEPVLNLVDPARGY